MELREVVRRRRMVRNYAPAPVDPAVVDRLLEAAHRAPSAGNTQGRAFVLLDTPEDVTRFWRATAGDRLQQPDRWLRGMTTAPVLVVLLVDPSAYDERYAEPDKRPARDARRSGVPWWHTDAAMAAMAMLLGAVDEGLGACFFGVPERAVPALRSELGVPDGWTPTGVVSLGHRADDLGSPGSSGRGRPPLAEVVHRGGW